MSSAPEYITTPTLFRHTKRTDWGMGLVVAEGPLRRRFEFEDGNKRTIARGFYHLLERVPASTPEVRRTLDALMDEQRQRTGHAADRPRPRVDVDAALAAQIATLQATFPDRFSDPRWMSDVRGEGAARAFKRHREPALRLAKTALAQDALSLAIHNGAGASVIAGLISVLEATDLANVKSDLKPLEARDPQHDLDIARALLQLLYGDAPLNVRVDDFRTAMHRAGLKTSWSMVTVPMGLARPHELVVVRPGILRKQAKALGQPLVLPGQPEGRAYLEAQDVLHRLRRHLEAAGERPRDLVDVLDFSARSLAA